MTNWKVRIGMSHLKVRRLERHRLIAAPILSALHPLALDEALGVPPQPRDLQLLIAYHVVLLAEQLSDGLLLLLESRLQDQQGTEDARQLLVPQTTLALLLGTPAVELAHQLPAAPGRGPQRVLGAGDVLAQAAHLRLHLECKGEG